MLELNYLLIVFIGIYLLQMVFFLWLERLNHNHLLRLKDKVPEPFKGVIDKEKLAKINSYTLENSRLGQLEQISDDLFFLGIILFGFLPVLDFHFLNFHFVVTGIIFFVVLGFISAIIKLPFDYYHTFVVEEKYDFNKSTTKIWITDHLKQQLISIILVTIVFSPVLWIIKAFPDTWWFWGFVVVSLVQILLTVLYPIVIAPLFNKFEPLKDQTLAESINKLMQDAGIKLKGIFQMDAGKRSRHTNAYFTGIGNTKRVVLFDTLIESNTHEETLAVLAHEIGHFKKKHVLKQLVVFELFMLIGFYLTWRVMNWDLLYSTFAFKIDQYHVGLILVGVFWQKAAYFLKPLYMSLSRRFERQADAFAVNLVKTAQPMIEALKRLAVDNLANLNPHPFYTRFNYSHPPLVERITLLEKLE
jgi:STE24 endopeptidase